MGTAYPDSEKAALKRWPRRIAFLLAALLLIAVAGYLVRCSLLLSAARLLLERESDVLAQEKESTVAIAFATPPPPWIMPMKNAMNQIWQPLGADGVNYYTFAGPDNLFRSYSERSNPESPYYQAWVGGYVTKRHDKTLPEDLPAWAKQVTELDQRSWLAAMGDPHPLAISSVPTSEGHIVVDGRTLVLWHGSMRSHSDLNGKADTALAMLVGMPPTSSWPSGTRSFHEVTLDGYFVCWSDAARRISVVIYAVAATPVDAAPGKAASPKDIKVELLALMQTAKLDAVR